jgi:hypothetical protein
MCNNSSPRQVILSLRPTILPVVTDLAFLIYPSVGRRPVVRCVPCPRLNTRQAQAGPRTSFSYCQAIWDDSLTRVQRITCSAVKKIHIWLNFPSNAVHRASAQYILQLTLADFTAATGNSAGRNLKAEQIHELCGSRDTVAACRNIFTVRRL